MNPIEQADPEVWQAIAAERRRQQDGLEMIASENYTSPAVLAAQGSVLTNKYAEGYPGKRYYGGCECVDVAERLAIDRACKLFGAEHANVQPHSGAQANMAVYFACLEPGDVILAMNLAHGGHLTHGMHLNFSGKLYKVVPLRRPQGRRAHRLRPGGRPGPRAQAEAGGGRRQRLPAHHRLQPLRRDLQGGRRAVHGGHGPHRRVWWRAISTPAPCRGPTSRPRRRTRRCAARAAASSCARRNGRRRSTRPCSPECRAGR